MNKEPVSLNLYLMKKKSLNLCWMETDMVARVKFSILGGLVETIALD